MRGASSLQSWLQVQWRSNGGWSIVVRPLALLYGAISGFRRARYLNGKGHITRCQVPVIVVGNIYVGGTGKTPIICDLANRLRAQGWQPGLVSRGYGRRQTPDPVVGQHAINWETFGDEPALIAKQTQMPVCVHADRGLAAQTLLKSHPNVDVILSDDGLQHYRLARDIEILVEDERGIGNGQLLPAGPLRESANRRAEVDAILTRSAASSEGHQHQDSHVTPEQYPPSWSFGVDIDCFWCPATNQSLSIQAFTALVSSHSPTLALAGIGVPQRFFDSLRSLGLKLDDTVALADHAALGVNWLTTREAMAARTILITEKDAVKCTDLTDPRIWVARASVHWHEAGFFDWLSKKLWSVARQFPNHPRATET